MRAPTTLLRLLRPEAAENLAYALLLWALLPLGEILLMVYLGSIVGPYLVLAVSAGSVLAGVLVALAQIRAQIVQMRRRVSRGERPGSELANIAGIFVAALLLASPGLLSDLAAFVLLSPALRVRVGAALLAKVRVDPVEVHEALKLAEALAFEPPGEQR